jgi:hypothetical protein
MQRLKKTLRELNDLAAQALAEFESIDGNFVDTDSEPFFRAWERALAAHGALLDAIGPCLDDDASPQALAAGKAALAEANRFWERVAPIREAQHLITAEEWVRAALPMFDPDVDRPEMGNVGEGYTTKDELERSRKLVLALLEDGLMSSAPGIKTQIEATADPSEQRRIALEGVRNAEIGLTLPSSRR